MSNASSSPTPPTTSWPLIAVLGWLVPGLGHWMLGLRHRGAVIGLTLLLLFAGGLLIGGMDVVDPVDDTIWFIPQAGLGPVTAGLGLAHVVMDKQAAETGKSVFQRSIGRVNEMGTLYCAIAGVLNLLAILDAVHRQIDREAKAL